MHSYHPPFLTSTTYHIYNHANGDDNIFREQDNYRFFLEKYVKYINPVADTFAYCLMRNHFHLMVRIKDIQSFNISSKTSKVFEDLGGLEFDEKDISNKVSKSFSNLFNSYTKSFNKKYERMGSLFAPNVKRKQIINDSYFTSLIVYIHNNPVHHGFVQDIWDWSHSSYQGILEENDSIVEVKEILEWFGNKNAFVEAHKNTMGLRSAFD
ncbi:MAG: hypothetical protein KAI99_03770 [Cyclobacteriaceae bacterium]|nr:hypothetical protein [Cyclobacteriaceae bacterium]MCK5467593.1 hypothetical protein [Cyclobacteriaceae bacterium]